MLLLHDKVRLTKTAYLTFRCNRRRPRDREGTVVYIIDDLNFGIQWDGRKTAQRLGNMWLEKVHAITT